MSLLTDNLFESTLIKPVEEGADTLYVVSGYATGVMAMRHFDYLRAMKKKIKIRLIAGMYIQDGILNNNHISFKDLHSDKYDVDFQCRYIISRPPVHSKVYAWFAGDKPMKGYVGSANYTQNAFSSSMCEVLYETNPILCRRYYEGLIGNTALCDAPNIEELISVFEKRPVGLGEEQEADSEGKMKVEGLERVTLTLLDARTGDVPNRSGLNWGQRPGRDPAQAYLNIPAEIGRSGFFPDRYIGFTVITDDNKQLVCVRAQDGGKGLHTTLNNSLMGEYFRNRLGLARDSFISKNDLLRYGRTDVDFYKIDEETYFLDFSV